MTAATESLQGQRRRAQTAPAVRDWLAAGGWHTVSTRGGGLEGGVTSHRGVLHPDEWAWLDREAVATAVERELGFTLADIRAVYRQGRKSPAQRALRARIDARLLALAESGGNMALLGSILGFYVGKNRKCAVITSALARARQRREA